MYIFVFDLRVI